MSDGLVTVWLKDWPDSGSLEIYPDSDRVMAERIGATKVTVPQSALDRYHTAVAELEAAEEALWSYRGVGS